MHYLLIEGGCTSPLAIIPDRIPSTPLGIPTPFTAHHDEAQPQFPQPFL